MTMLSAVLFLLGLVLLVVGAEALVRGAGSIARSLGISALIIGLTVVAFGTSAPEIAISIQAGLADQSGIALGNAVGSNIFNILCILGISALAVPLVVQQQLVRLDVPLLIGASVLAYVMSRDGVISTIDGLILFALVIVYIGILIVVGKREPLPVQDEYEAALGFLRGRWSLPFDLFLVVAGIGMLVLGARWIVRGAVDIASYLGVSEVIISLTIVAAGTSLPEAATSVVAALRGQRDIAVGNAVGSSLFNLFVVLGLAAIITLGGLDVPDAVRQFDMLVMIGAAVACLPIFFTGKLIARWEGFVFFAYYIFYVTYLVLDATDNAAVEGYRTVMTFFVIPITVITIGTLALRGWHQERRRAARRAQRRSVG